MSQSLTIAPSRSITSIHPRDDMRPSFERGVREFQTEAEMKAASLEVRRRLDGRPAVIAFAPRVPEPEQVRKPYVPGPVAPRPSKVGPEKPKAARRIADESAEAHGVTVEQMKGKTRVRSVVAARFEAYYRMNTELGYSLPMIGRVMGDKDHSGVLHGINAYKKKLAALTENGK